MNPATTTALAAALIFLLATAGWIVAYVCDRRMRVALAACEEERERRVSALSDAACFCDIIRKDRGAMVMLALEPRADVRMAAIRELGLDPAQRSRIR